MLPLEKNQNSKSITHILACLSVFIYIVSAIAFEMTPETAIISTLAIYCVFAVGLLFAIQKNNILINEYFLFMVMFCLYVYLRNIAQNASSTEGMRTAYLTLTCVIVCIFVFWMSSKYPNMLSLAMVAYILGALILSVRIIMAYGGISEMILYASAEGENRVGGLMGNENGIGLFLANGILCSVMFLLKNKLPIVKILTSVAMLSLGAMLLLTGSRKSLAFVLVGVVLMVYFNYRKAKAGKKIFAFLLVVIGLTLVYIAITKLPMFSTINERLGLLFEGFWGDNSSYQTDQTRKMMISQGMEAFYEKPILGHGTGYSYKLFGTYSHNNFVELLMNYGMVGFILYYAVYFFLIVKLWHQVKQGDLYAVYFFVYIGVQLLLGVGWVNYYERPVQMVTALAFGYLWHAKKKQKGDEIGENKKSV